METITSHAALTVCIVGGVVFAICDGREGCPPFIAKLAFVAFGAGLLACLLGK